MSYTVWAVEYIESPSEHYIARMFSSEEKARCFLRTKGEVEEGAILRVRTREADYELDSYEVFTEEE